MTSGGRNFGLDLVRALAISWVLLAHSLPLWPDPNAVRYLRLGGFFGVELFFVLSGLLVGSILLRTLETERGDGLFARVRHFWIRRWFRTLPNYYLFLLLNLTLFAWLFGPLEWDWRYLLFLQNLAWSAPPMMPEAWSLAVEEWFYLSFPLALLLALLLPGQPSRRLLLGILAYILLFSLLRLYQADDASLRWGAEVRRVVVVRLDAIGYGVLIAWLLRYHESWMRRLWAWLALAGLALVGWSAYLYVQGILGGQVGELHRGLLFSSTDLGLSLLLPAFLRLGSSGWIEWSIAWLSRISYSAYLLHLSLVLPIARQWLLPALGSTLALVSYLLITLVLSALVYGYYERPMTGLRERFAPRSPRIDRATPSD